MKYAGRGLLSTIADLLHELLPELAGRLFFHFLELLAEVCPAFIAAFITDFQYRFAGTGKQLAGVADAQVADEVEIGFLDVLLEEATEGGNRHIGHFGYLLQGDGLQEMLERVVDDLFDGGVYGHCRVVEVFGEQFILIRGADGLQAFDE